MGRVKSVALEAPGTMAILAMALKVAAMVIFLVLLSTNGSDAQKRPVISGGSDVCLVGRCPLQGRGYYCTTKPWDSRRCKQDSRLCRSNGCWCCPPPQIFQF